MDEIERRRRREADRPGQGDRPDAASARASAGEAADLSAKRYRQILDSAIDFAIVATDLDGRVTHWNEGAHRVLGWTEDEMLGHPVDRFFTPEDVVAGRVATEMRNALETGRGNDERWHRRKSGERFWAVGEVTVLRDEEGAPVGFVKVLRDRTEQRRAEERQRADAEFMRSVLASSSDCIKVLDLDGNLVFMSEGGQRVMEVSDFNAISGCPWPSFWQGPGRDDAEAALATAKAGGVGRFQGPADTVAGTPRYWDVQVTAILDAEGRPEKLLSISRDITASWRAETTVRDSEAALRLQREFLDTVIRQAPVGISIVEARQGGIQVVNDKARELLGDGETHSGAGPYHPHGAVHADGRSYAVDDYPTMRVLGTGVGVEREEMIYVPGGLGPQAPAASRRLEVSSTPVRDEAGAIVAAVTTFVDVEEERRAEAAMRASEAHWRGLFAKLHEGLLVGELVRDAAGRVTDWRYLDVNPAWSNLVGIAPEAAVGRTIRDLFPGIEGAWVDEMATVVESGRPASFTRKVASLDRWYDGRVFALGGDRFAALFLEVTERHREERRRSALLRLGNLLRDTVDPARMSYVAAEVLGGALDVTRAGYGTVSSDGAWFIVERDWTTAEGTSLAGSHTLRDFGSYVDELRRGLAVVIDDVARDPRTVTSAEALRQVGVGALVNLPVIEQGRLVAVLYANCSEAHAWTAEEVAFSREVAARTRSEIERRRAEGDLVALATSLERQVDERTRERDRVWRNAQDMIVIIDGNGVFREANPAVARVLGWDPEEMVGQTVFAFVLPEDADATEGALSHAIDDQLPIYVNRYRHKDGSHRWISWVAAPEGDLIYAYGRDVTAERERAEVLRQTEEALRQSQKMEAVGQLTGGLAHDFNNLLTGISGSLDLLQKRVAQGRINDLDRYVIAAQGASKRAAALTHRLLAFSRRQTLDPRPTDVRKLVAGMTDLIRRTVGPEITVEAVDMVGLWNALVDPSQLENALLNLCINARDAMPDGGRITIETANRWMDDRAAHERGVPSGQYLSLCVSDTGSGMPPDVVARAFDPFFTTKPLGQGTGLGLSMIYGFARQSGGQVRIYSEVGEGSMVCIYLPRHYGAEDHAEHAAAGGEVPRAEAGETVLVVDDEPTVRMLVVDVLSDLGYAAIEAEDGPAGLEVLRGSARVDLLVTDVGLPGGMNGRQVADAARVLRPDLKVLFITGYAENAAVGNGHLDPGMAVLTKPFAMDDLAAKIRALIER